MLGNTLGSIIKTHDRDAFEAVEKLRSCGREWRSAGGDEAAFDEMVSDISTYDTKKLLVVARAFTHFLALSNSAENHHRIRRLRQRMMGHDGALSPKEDSCDGTVHRLVFDKLKSPKDVHEALCRQSVEIVLTAHPTEVNRRTMLAKHQRVKEILEAFDRADNSPYEIRQLNRQLHSEIASIWETDELRRSKPTPVEEARGGLNVVENVLWRAVPDFLRKLDDVSKAQLGEPLPLDVAPIKMASWMGGDRDGNPNVTPAITKEVCNISRWTAARLFLGDIRTLQKELSVRGASDELIEYSKGAREPYRYVLKELEQRLTETVKWTEENAVTGQTTPLDETQIFTNTAELMEPLQMMHQSLISQGRPEIADGLLTDTIRRLAAFGLSMLPLDLRQESSRHAEALDAITQRLELGSYLSWDETTRREWLCKEISSKRPLLPKGTPLRKLGFSDTVVDTLETFELVAKLTPGSLGAYVISQCQQASDVLAVTLLQIDAGVLEPLRVVPLFETLDDLERSAATMEALFSMPAYKDHIRGKQEIMVGYSDSAKDAGRLAASWAQYKCQEEMVQIGANHGIELTFFHGKGGTVGRGGNPALYRAIMAHPPNTINGRFRVTEQGEMITQNFGQNGIAERTLDLFTAGVLAESFEERFEPNDEWRNTMERLSDVSCENYRHVVTKDSRFVPYFRAATPELELSGLNVGSRPAKRNPTGGVESLRAIPWVFAWTQTRLNLPAWLGVGKAFDQEMKEKDVALRDMYQNWTWFHTLVDLLEMILAKSDVRVAENYDNVLLEDTNDMELGKELREKMESSAKAVLSVSGNAKLQQHNPVLMRSLEVRNPYIDPLNIIQAELLRRIRENGASITEKEKERLSDALLITINGVAAGMRNSG
jgi:phosphoenolpyruvate carboxylase